MSVVLLGKSKYIDRLDIDRHSQTRRGIFYIRPCCGLNAPKIEHPDPPEAIQWYSEVYLTFGTPQHVIAFSIYAHKERGALKLIMCLGIAKVMY